MPRSFVLGAGLWTALAAAAGAQEPTPDAARARLAERADNVRAEAKAHAEAEAAAARAHAAELAAAGIPKVEPLGTPSDPARAVDIVFIGDGFTAPETAEYEQVVARMVQNFQTAPFDAYPRAVNCYRVNLISPESGIDVDGTEVDTPLKGAVRPAGAGKLLALDVQRAVELCRAAVPEVDYVVAVLNTHGAFLGSANTGPIVRMSSATVHRGSLVVHEFAHNFGAFLDEYVDQRQGGDAAPNPRVEGGINATLESNVYLAKWHHWNIPEDVFRGRVRKHGKPFEFGDVVRCYEGGATYFNNVYRAEENCHMQRGRGKAFCRVCTEGLEVELYRFVTPIAGVTPLATRQRIGLTDACTLAVEPVTVTGADDVVRVRFWNDGAAIAERKVKRVTPRRGAAGGPRWECALTGTELGVGTHHVTVTVDIDSPRVHMDQGRLGGAFAWTVEVSPRGPTCKAPAAVKGTVGTAVAVFVENHPDGAPGEWVCANPPDGAAVTEADGTRAVRFTPQRAGRYRLEFRQAADDFVARRSVDVTVAAAEPRGNHPPVFCFHPPVTAVGGRPLITTLTAYDPDNDHLAYAIADLPEGASLHPDTGILTWTPGRSQAGTYALAATVTDGTATAKLALTLTVTGWPLFRGIFRHEDQPACATAADRWCVALHAPDPEARWTAIGQLGEAPPDCALAHWLRLLRFPQPRVWQQARDRLQALFAARAADPDPAAATGHLALFLDQLSPRVWQFVDAPEKLALIRGCCTTALATPGLSAVRTRALKTLVDDLDLIDWYNAERKRRPGPEPIRDKKFK